MAAQLADEETHPWASLLVLERQRPRDQPGQVYRTTVEQVRETVNARGLERVEQLLVNLVDLTLLLDRVGLLVELVDRVTPSQTCWHCGENDIHVRTPYLVGDENLSQKPAV